jgi:hypothetical protein
VQLIEDAEFAVHVRHPSRPDIYGKDSTPANALLDLTARLVDALNLETICVNALRGNVQQYQQPQPQIPAPDWGTAPDWAQSFAINPGGYGMWWRGLVAHCSVGNVQYPTWRAVEPNNVTTGYAGQFHIPVGVDWRSTLQYRPLMSNEESDEPTPLDPV